MNRALVFTAWNRPLYWQLVCQSWACVDTTGWDVVLRVEPSEHADEMIQIFEEESEITDYLLIQNPERYGVLVHPWVAFEELFREGYDFVVRAEDDLLVSADILRYFEFASERWADDPSIATVHAYTRALGDEFQVSIGANFNPLVWGTWRDRWEEYIGPTWDKDYSTNNGTPGVHAGWDWNLNTRVLPRLGKRVVGPERSRVQNVGEHGVHATPENFEQAPGWSHDYGPGTFWTPA